MAYKGPKLSQLHGAQRDARIKQLLANPGTRKLVPTADLPAEMRAKRALNQRLAQPIVPGSSTTQRDLAHQREAAVNLQYGPNAVGASQLREKETGDWYDGYLAEIAKHAGNVQGFGQQAQDQIAGLTNIQGPTDAQPQDAQNQGIAAQAAAVRSALLGGLKTKIQGQATAANTYADTLAHVVAPGQKVQALTAARGNTDQLRQQIGAYRTKYEGDARTEESKNVLARQALGVDITKAKSDAAADAANIDLKRGVDPVTGRALPKDPKTPSVITSGAFAGYTKEQVAGMSPAHKQKLKTDYDAGKGKAKAGDPATQDAKNFYAKYGVKPVSTAAVSSAQDAIQGTTSLVPQIADAIRKENKGISDIEVRKQAGRVLLTGQKGAKDSLAIPKTKGLWATVALDLYFLKGRVSAGTADRLHKAGYSVKTLGLTTATGRPPKPPRKTGQQNLGGSGHL